MITSTNNDSNAAALVAAFQKWDGDDAKWREKIAPTVEALEKSAGSGGFQWNGETYTSIKKWVPKAFGITYRAFRYRVTGGNPVAKRSKKSKKGETAVSPLTDVKVGIGSHDLMGKDPLQIGAYGGKMTVRFWREHDETYTAKLNGAYALLDHMTETIKKKNGHINENADHKFSHTVKELEGEFTVEVWMPNASEKEITKALLVKTKDTLKALHIKDGYKEVVAALKSDREDAERYEAETREKEKKETFIHARLGNVTAQCGVRLRGSMVFVNMGDIDKVTCPKCKRALKANVKSKPADKPVDPQKELMKRFRLAKRAAKFFAGMQGEFDAMDGLYDDKYGNLLELYPSNGDDHRFPWTPPTKGYDLPKTREEFQAECDKAWGEFDAVMAEGKAAGVLTDAPRIKPEVTVLVKDCKTEEAL